MKTTITICLLFASTFSSINVYAESTREQFQQLVVQLQKNPGDNDLREQVIKKSLRLKPHPAIPEDARRFLVRGNTVMSDAKSNEDYAHAAELYVEALRIAPWWPDAYFNLAKARELQSEYSDAIDALKNYLLTNPPRSEARTMQDHIYVLEEKRDKQAGEVAAKKREEENRQRIEQEADSVIQRVQAIVSGKQYERWVASANNPNTDRVTGVNEAESHGSIWWGWPGGTAVQQYVIQGKTIKICFITDEGRVTCSYGITGTPNGPNISDIVWSQNGIDGDENKSKRVWARFYERDGEFQYSPDRPVSDSEFNPNVRYQYWWYRLYPVKR